MLVTAHMISVIFNRSVIQAHHSTITIHKQIFICSTTQIKCWHPTAKTNDMTLSKTRQQKVNKIVWYLPKTNKKYVSMSTEHTVHWLISSSLNPILFTTKLFAVEGWILLVAVNLCNKVFVYQWNVTKYLQLCGGQFHCNCKTIQTRSYFDKMWH